MDSNIVTKDWLKIGWQARVMIPLLVKEPQGNPMILCLEITFYKPIDITFLKMVRRL
jgi:hypothetical protein